MQVSKPVLACSCLPGEIYRKGVGVALVQFLKKEIEYKCMELGRGVYAADGKNRPGVMALAVSGRETRGYVGVSSIKPGKNIKAWLHRGGLESFPKKDERNKGRGMRPAGKESDSL